MRRAPAALVVAGLIAAMLAKPGISQAEQAGTVVTEAARQHERGIDLYQRGDYEGAIEAFQAAQHLVPTPPNLFNMARCSERLGRIMDAVRTLDEYLLMDIPAEQRDRAQEFRRNLLASPGSVTFTSTPPGAAILVDGAPPEGAPTTPATLDLSPGTHRIEVRRDGYQSSESTISVEPGGEHAVLVQLVTNPTAIYSSPDLVAPGPVSGVPISRRGFTGTLGIGAGVSFPAAMESLSTGFALDLDLSAGVRLLGGHRLAFVAEVYLVPHGAGLLLEANGGVRYAAQLGRVPLWIELQVALGLSYLSVNQSGLLVAEGDYSSLGLVPSLALVWEARPWLELAFHVARLDVLGLAGDLPGGVSVRYGLDLALRFRFPAPSR